LALDELKKNEKPVSISNFEILIEDHVTPYSTGQILDYVRVRHGEGFVLKPAAGSCC
jgi:hypothetical protein